MPLRTSRAGSERARGETFTTLYVRNAHPKRLLLTHLTPGVRGFVEMTYFLRKLEYVLHVLQRVIHKVTGKAKILSPFAADEVKITGYFEVIYRHFNQIAIG